MKSTCAKCKHVFGGVSAFDAHRAGSYRERQRRCLSIAEMAYVGLTQNDKGWWCKAVSASLARLKNGIVSEACG